MEERQASREDAAEDEDRDATIRAMLPLVYDELRALAASYLAGDRQHTLQPTALVHEAYVRLAGRRRAWSGRDHFMAAAATAMRHVLVDHARRRRAEKRGGSAARADLDIATVLEGRSIEDRSLKDRSEVQFRVLELDDLLTQLSAAHERTGRVAEMRLFGGMTEAQIAAVLDVSRMTVTTDWGFARAWLTTKAGLEGRGR